MLLKVTEHEHHLCTIGVALWVDEGAIEGRVSIKAAQGGLDSVANLQNTEVSGTC
jgi:hypothetical protein